MKYLLIPLLLILSYTVNSQQLTPRLFSINDTLYFGFDNNQANFIFKVLSTYPELKYQNKILNNKINTFEKIKRIDELKLENRYGVITIKNEIIAKVDLKYKNQVNHTKSILKKRREELFYHRAIIIGLSTVLIIKSI